MGATVTRSKKAFTLLEVLVALAIFALAAVVLSSAYLNVITGYEMVRRNHAMEEDLRWVRSMVLQQADREEVEMGGDLESPYLGLVTWRALVEPLPVPDLFFVTLEISYSGEGELSAGELAQSFTLMRPTWSEPVDRAVLQEETAQRLREYQMAREGRS